MLNSKPHFDKVKKYVAAVAEKPVVWFGLELDGDILFHVEKKQGGSTKKFKNGKAIVTYINKITTLPTGWTLSMDTKKMKICGGMVWKEEEVFHMTCSLKVQGGGKSTLKKIMNGTGVKLGMGNFSKIVYEKSPPSKEDRSAESKTEALETPSADKKIYKLHAKVTGGLEWFSKKKSSGFQSKDTDKLESLLRRLSKYTDKKVWKKTEGWPEGEEALNKSEIAAHIIEVSSQLEGLLAIIDAEDLELEALMVASQANIDGFEAAISEDFLKAKAEAEAKAKAAKKKKKTPKPKQPGSEDEKRVRTEAYLENLRINAREIQGKVILETNQLADLLGATASYAATKIFEGEAQKDVTLEVGTRQAMAEVDHVRRMRKARGEDDASAEYGVGSIPSDDARFKTKATDKDGNAPKMAHPDQIKANARIKDKKDKYKGDYSEFTDIARSSLVFQTPAELLASQRKIIEYFDQRGQRIVNEKNRFAEPTDDGYSDILLNVKGPDGHIFEFQLHVEALNKAKGHCASKEEWIQKWDMISRNPLYEQLRTSAMILLKENQSEEGISLPTKAADSAVKVIKASADIEISGHDLYNVKRHLFEKSPKEHEQHLFVWTKAAKELFYGPAAAEIADKHGPDLEALKGLTFKR